METKLQSSNAFGLTASSLLSGLRPRAKVLAPMYARWAPRTIRQCSGLKVLCGASNQRADVVSGGAAVFFGLFGRCGLTGFGGSMGCSVATTGLGSILDVPGVMKPAGLPVTATGTVTGRKPSRA